MKNIPDRWRDYSPCNWTPIENQRIILFKTPLSQKYNSSSPSDNGIMEEERFTPTDLIEKLEEQSMKLGMVLDFTFTTRYYDPREFKDRGIIYKKMMCAGHVIPKKKDIKRFQREVKNFIAKDKSGSLVGVHCTHGVNRTGYMVCRYLIDVCGYKPDDAIEAFNKARGHPLERQNYLEDLRKPRKQDEIEEDEKDDSEQEEVNNRERRLRINKEYRSKPHGYDWSIDRPRDDNRDRAYPEYRWVGSRQHHDHQGMYNATHEAREGRERYSRRNHWTSDYYSDYSDYYGEPYSHYRYHDRYSNSRWVGYDRDYSSRDSSDRDRHSNWNRWNLYDQRLELTSPTSRSRTERSHENSQR